MISYFTFFLLVMPVSSAVHIFEVEHLGQWHVLRVWLAKVWRFKGHRKRRVLVEITFVTSFWTLEDCFHVFSMCSCRIAV